MKGYGVIFWRKALKVLLLIIAFSMTSSLVFSSSNKSTVTDIRYSTNEKYTRVVVELDKKASYEPNLLKFPDRLYFDIQDTDPGTFHKETLEINDNSVKTVQVSEFDQKTTRVVLSLGSYDDYNIYTLQSPDRIVIDINHGVKVDEFIPRKKIVVIDAGHGGKDPGAIGRRGLKEKDVVLDVSKRVKEILESKYAVKVYMTRESDKFVELRRRASYANSIKADVFISIHANASRKRGLRGIETWFLNHTNNLEYQKVAARENAISLEEQKKYESVKDQILADLDTSLKRDTSGRLARYIQSSMIKNLKVKYKSRIVDLDIKYARFYVLFTDMPSALLEIGYISNPKEELMMRRTSYRKDLALSIAKGINSFLSTLPDMPKLASR
ncbi:MAG: N-acetylmuramoyl-L-alanine amidase [Nitrospirota bacterium]|nr:MAG: N-acetylmuramoyl-L-alanine amidase [Nitrospirota bacterium]